MLPVVYMSLPDAVPEIPKPHGIHTVFTLVIGTEFFFSANNVDQDQTAHKEQSGLGLHCLSFC